MLDPDSIEYKLAKKFSQWTANPITKEPGHLYISAARHFMNEYDITPKEPQDGTAERQS